MKHFIPIFLVSLCFVNSCRHNPADNEFGSDMIRVEINSHSFEASDVQGHEYLGYYCSGTVNGKRIDLALGTYPQIGDTLRLSDQVPGISPVYARYADYHSIPNSGMIVITGRRDHTVAGKFSFVAVAGTDTLNFTNGYFSVQFEPLR